MIGFGWGWWPWGWSPVWGGPPPAMVMQYLYETGQMSRFQRWLQERWGYGYGYAPGPLSEEEEVAMLRDQAKALEEQLAQIRRRLEELEKGRKE